MFTGIIEATARVLDKTDSGLLIERPLHFDDVKIGSSIAVSGACLSVTHMTTKDMKFDVVPTTVQKTKLGSLNTGDRVNLERAMPASGRFEGHIVTGHVEGVGSVTFFEQGILTITLPEALEKYVVRHGSITIDGVSLTVADAKGTSVTVALIPLTYRETTLGNLRKGDTVNIESDILAKYLLSPKHGTQ